MVCCYSSPDFPRLVQVSQFDVQLRQTNRSLLAHGLEHDFLVGFLASLVLPLTSWAYAILIIMTSHQTAATLSSKPSWSPKVVSSMRQKESMRLMAPQSS